MDSRRRLRILALHSWRTSAKIFKEQFARVQLGLEIEELAELVFVDAPHSNKGPPPKDVAGIFEGPYYEWFTIHKSESQQPGGPPITAYMGLEQSEEYLCQIMREQGPFDGLIGFSQGGLMASVLVAQQRAGLLLQDMPPLRFVLLFGSVMSHHPRHVETYQGRVQVPSCHVVGHQDWVKEHAIDLARQFQNPIVIMHPRGHVIPRLQGPHLAVLKSYLASFMNKDMQQEQHQQQGRPDSQSIAVPYHSRL